MNCKGLSLPCCVHDENPSDSSRFQVCTVGAKDREAEMLQPFMLLGTCEEGSCSLPCTERMMLMDAAPSVWESAYTHPRSHPSLSPLLPVPQHPSAAWGPACSLRNESERELFCRSLCREYSLLQPSSVHRTLPAPAPPGTEAGGAFLPPVLLGAHPALPLGCRCGSQLPDERLGVNIWCTLDGADSRQPPANGAGVIPPSTSSAPSCLGAPPGAAVGRGSGAGPRCWAEGQTGPKTSGTSSG